MSVTRCTVAQIPAVGARTLIEKTDPDTGLGLYEPDLATLEAAHPGWADVGFDDSIFEPCDTYLSLPSPWGVPSVAAGAAWMSDPYVQDHGFVTAKNWAGRWRWFPEFGGTIISASIDVECTDILEVVRFNGVDVMAGPVPPDLIEHSGGAGNVIATYLQSVVLDPYAAIAWAITMEVVDVPARWPLLRASVPAGGRMKGRHHA